MNQILPFAALTFCAGALAQAPPSQTGAGQTSPGQQQAPRGTQQSAPVPQPGNQPVPNPMQAGEPGAQGAPISLTLPEAMQSAARYSQQVYSARFTALLAHEDAVQAKAALLPAATGFSQFIYTQPNGTPSGVFVANDGPHIYNDQVIVHGELFNPAKRADYQRLLAVEAVARARADLASRGLI